MDEEHLKRDRRAEMRNFSHLRGSITLSRMVYDNEVLMEFNDVDRGKAFRRWWHGEGTGLFAEFYHEWKSRHKPMG